MHEGAARRGRTKQLQLRSLDTTVHDNVAKVPQRVSRDPQRALVACKNSAAASPV